jgi:hypothetical protein
MSAPPSHSLWLFGLSIIPIGVPAGCFARMARPLDRVWMDPDSKIWSSSALQNFGANDGQSGGGPALRNAQTCYRHGWVERNWPRGGEEN